MRPARPTSRPSTGPALRRTSRIAAAFALIAAYSISPRPDPIGPAILGQRPAYAPSAIGDVPNSTAIDRLIWVPGLDAGWDPQGLAFAEGKLFVSAYQSHGAWQFRGPCRVFRIDPETGRDTGHIDVPQPCGHAGGLAYSDGKLFVADTRSLFEFDLDRAFSAAKANYRVFPLGPGLKGAFAASENGAIWIGGYEESRPAKIFKFDLATIQSLRDGATLTSDLASAVVSIPTYGQGGAIDSTGKLWISRSDLGWGFLDRLDAAGGRFEQRYAMPAGIEGMAFDEHGALWGVSEAGARHLPLRYPFFPLIFRLDPRRLVPAD
jgi:outer membrane protein assembly factor BamB